MQMSRQTLCWNSSRASSSSPVPRMYSGSSSRFVMASPEPSAESDEVMRPLIPTPTPAPCTLKGWRPSIRTVVAGAPRHLVRRARRGDHDGSARGPARAAEGRRSRGRSRDAAAPCSPRTPGSSARPALEGAASRWRPTSAGSRRSRTSSSPRGETDWTWTCTRPRHSAGPTASGTRSPQTPSPWTRRTGGLLPRPSRRLWRPCGRPRLSARGRRRPLCGRGERRHRRLSTARSRGWRGTGDRTGEVSRRCGSSSRAARIPRRGCRAAGRRQQRPPTTN